MTGAKRLTRSFSLALALVLTLSLLPIYLPLSPAVPAFGQAEQDTSQPDPEVGQTPTTVDIEIGGDFVLRAGQRLGVEVPTFRLPEFSEGVRWPTRYDLSGGPDWLTENNTVLRGRFSNGEYAPAEVFPRTTLTLTFSDSSNPPITGSTTFEFEVIAADAPFAFTGFIPDAFNGQVGSSGSVTFPKASGTDQPIQYCFTIDTACADWTVADDITESNGLRYNRRIRSVYGTPTAVPSDGATLKASFGTDLASNEVSMTIPFNVAEEPFAIDYPVDSYKVRSGATLDLTLPQATGGEGSITYSATGLPSWVTFTASSRTFSGTVPATAETSTITYTATDSATPNAATTSDSFDLVVLATGDIGWEGPDFVEFDVPVGTAITQTLTGLTGTITESEISRHTSLTNEICAVQANFAHGNTRTERAQSGITVSNSASSGATVSGTPSPSADPVDFHVWYLHTDSDNNRTYFCHKIRFNITTGGNPLALPDQGTFTFRSGQGFPVEGDLELDLRPATGGTPPYQYFLKSAAPWMDIDPETATFQTSTVASVTTATSIPFTLVAEDSTAPLGTLVEMNVDATAIPANSFGLVGHYFDTYAFTVGQPVNIQLPQAGPGTEPDACFLNTSGCADYVVTDNTPARWGLTFNHADATITGLPDTTTASTQIQYSARESATATPETISFNLEVTATPADLVFYRENPSDDPFMAAGNARTIVLQTNTRYELETARTDDIDPPSFPRGVGEDENTTASELDYSIEAYPAGGEVELPEGLRTDYRAGRRTFRGTPTTIQPATNYLWCAGKDGQKNCEVFSITINHGPVTLSGSVPAQTWTQGQTVNLRLPEAQGGDTNYTYTVSTPLPDGISFDPATRVLSGVPTSTIDSATPVTLTYTVSDGQTTPSTASLDFTVVIGASSRLVWDETNFVNDDPPEIVIPAYQEINDVATATAMGGIQPYTYSIRPTLPAGLTLDTTTGTLSGTARAVIPTQTHTLIMTDSANSVLTANLSIRTNTSPEFIRMPNDLTLQTAGSMSSLIFNLDRYVLDVDGTELTYEAQIISGSTLISVTPVPDRANLFTVAAIAGIGQGEIELTVTDPDGETISTRVGVVVEESAGPTYVGEFPDSNDDPLALGDLETHWLRVDSAFSDSNTNESLRFALTPGSYSDPQPALLTVFDPYPTTRFYACAPGTTCTAATDLTATITAIDSAGMTASFELNYNLTPHTDPLTANYENDPIVLSPIPTLSLTVGEQVSFPIIDLFDDYEADAVTDVANTKAALTVAVSGLDTNVATHALADLTGVEAASQIFENEITFTAVGVGASTPTITVTEPFGSSPASASQTLTIAVTDPFRFTEEIPAAVVGSVDEQFNLSLPAGAGGTAPYTYVLSTENLPEGITYTEDAAATPPTRTLSGTFTTPSFGDATVTYTVTDANNNSLEHQIQFSVLSVTNPLRWDETSYRGMTVSSLDHLPIISINSWETVDFPLAQAEGGTAPYTYSALYHLPYGLEIDQNTAVVTGMAQEGVSDGHFTLEVTDSATPPATSTLVIPIEVNPIPLIERQLEDVELIMGIDAEFDLARHFDDPEGEQLNYHLAIIEGNSVTITKDANNPRWTFSPQSFGDTVMRVAATDADMGVTSYDFTVTVGRGSAPEYYGDLETPFIAAPLPSGADNYLYIPFTHMFDDPDEGDELTITFEAVAPIDGLDTLTDITPVLTRINGNTSGTNRTEEGGVSFCTHTNPCSDDSEFDILITATDLAMNQTTGRARIRIDTDNTDPEYNETFRANADLGRIYPLDDPIIGDALITRTSAIWLFLDEYFFVISQPPTLANRPNRSFSRVVEVEPGVAYDRSIHGPAITSSSNVTNSTSHYSISSNGRGNEGIRYAKINAEYNGTSISRYIPVRFRRFVKLSNPGAQEFVVGGENRVILPAASGGSGGGFDYSVSELPTGITFDLTSRTLVGTPATVENRIRSFTYTTADRKDSENTAELSVPYRLVAPKPLAFAFSTQPEVNVPTGVTMVDVPAGFPIHGKAPYSYTLTPELPSGLTFDSTSGHITGTPPPASNETQDYTLTVTDSSSPPSSIEAEISVRINTAPVWNNAPNNRDAVVNSTISLNLGSGFSDSENNPITYTVTATANASLVTIERVPDSDVWEITNDEVGTATIEVVATDSTGSTTTHSFDINIVANNPPEWVGNFPADTERGNDYLIEYQYQGNATDVLVPLKSMFVDDDPGDSLTFTATGSTMRSTDPAVTTTFDPFVRKLNLQDDWAYFCLKWHGTDCSKFDSYYFTLTITATDLSGASLSKTFNMDMDNSHPLTPIHYREYPDITIGVGESTRIDFADYVYQPVRFGVMEHTYTWSSTVGTDGIITNPTFNDEGVFTFSGEMAGSTEVTVTSNYASTTPVSDTFTVTVENRPRFASSQGNLNWETDTPTELLLPAASEGAPPYTYDLSPELPPGLSLEERELAGVMRTYIVGSPTDQAGTKTYTWTATDNSGLEASLDFSLRVVFQGQLSRLGAPTISDIIRYASHEGDANRPPRIQLTWGPPNSHRGRGIIYFQFDRREVGTDEWELIDTAPYNSGRTIDSLYDYGGVPGTTYEYRIAGYTRVVGQPNLRGSSFTRTATQPFPTNTAWTNTETNAYQYDPVAPEDWVSSSTRATNTLWRLSGPTELNPGDLTPTKFTVIKQHVVDNGLIGGNIPSRGLLLVDPSGELTFANVGSVSDCSADNDICLIGNQHEYDNDDAAAGPDQQTNSSIRDNGNAVYSATQIEDRRVYNSSGNRLISDVSGGINTRHDESKVIPWTTFEIEILLNPNTDFTDKDLLVGWDTGTPIRGNNRQLTVSLDNAVTAPPAPDAPTVTASGSAVNLAWTALTDYPTGFVSGWEYRVQDSAGTETVVDWTTIPGGAEATSHDIEGIEGGSEYRFQLRALNQVAGMHAETVFTPTLAPAAPHRLAARSATGEITLTWESLHNGGDTLTATQYRYKQSDETNWGAWTDLASPTALTVVISGLTDGTSYDVEVRGVNTVGDGVVDSVSLTPPDGVDLPNEPPVVASNDDPAVTLTTLQTKTLLLGDLFTDPEDETLTFTTADTMDSIAAITQETAGTLSIAGTAVGSFTAQIVATDPEGASVRRPLMITVIANRAPTVISGSTDITIAEATTQMVDLSTVFTDPDEDTLAYEISGVDDTLLEQASLDQATGQLSLTTTTVACDPTSPSCPLDHSASTAFQLTATDIGSESITIQMMVTITSTNQPPEIVGESTISQAVQVGETATVDLVSTFTDPDRNPLLFSLDDYTGDSTKESAATITLSDANYPNSLDLTVVGLAETPADNQGRDYIEVTVTASDGAESVSLTVRVSVTAEPVEDHSPTVLLSGDQPVSVAVGETADFDLSTVLAHPTAGSSLNFTQTGGDNTLATLTINGSQAQVMGVAEGTTTFTITGINPDAPTAQMGTGDRASFSLVVTITPAGTSPDPQPNRAPMVSSSDQLTLSVRVGRDITYEILNAFVDPDQDELTCTVDASGLDTQLATATFDSTNCTVTFTGVAAGETSYSLTVTDPGGLSASRDATIIIPPATSSRSTPRCGRAPTDEFTDDNESVHQVDIDCLAEMGISRGCNPPVNDRYCPERSITRGEMATFMGRLLDLEPATFDWFTDDDGSTHEDAINRLGEAQISLGCNPRSGGDRFCPNDPLSRGEMASFLARALNYRESTSRFTDIAGNVHEENINAIFARDITRGCNPPVNDRFCPDRELTRAEMATFLVRAFY